MAKIYFIGLLGADDVQDDWMSTDMSMIVTLMRANPDTIVQLFAVNSFRDYLCCQEGHYTFGESHSDRIKLAAPDDDIVIRNGSLLKGRFLQAVKSTTRSMTNNDKLLLFLVGHGKEEKGDFWVGNTLLSKAELKSVVAKNGQIFLWSTACYSGHWLEDVPWHGYVAASKDEQSDSLTESGSEFFRGGVNTITSLAALSAAQNIEFPPRSHKQIPAPPHYLGSPTTIHNGEILPLHKLTENANEIKDQQLWSNYPVKTWADKTTQRPLPLPELTSSFLKWFTIIPSTQVAITPVRNKTGKKDSAHLAMENVPFPWPEDVDLEELLDVASDLLASTGPRLTHCNILKIKLQRTPAHPGTIRALWAAFQHRNVCRRQLEKWLVVGWRMEKLPLWNTFYISSAGQNAVREFLDKFPEDARRYTKTLEFLAGEIEPTWLPLHWMEIRAEMALAWEAAGKPTFYFQEFKNVIDNVGDTEMQLRLRELKVEKLLQLNLRTWPHLCETLDDLGILATGRQYQSLPASVSTPF